MDEITPQVPEVPEVPAAPDAAAPPQAPEAPQQSVADVMRASLEGKKEPPADPATVPAVAPVGPQRGPDGKFLPKTGTTAAPQPTAALEAKPDPLAAPEGLTPDASARFQQLANMVKERDGQIQQFQQQMAQAQELVTGFQNMVVESQATDQEFSALMDYCKAIKTGDWRSAEPLLAAQIQQFRMATGRDPAGADPIAQHPDLSARLSSGALTPDIAMELARHRRQQEQWTQQQQAAQQQQAQTAQQQQQEQQLAQATNQAATTIASWVQTLKAQDLDFPKKEQMLSEYAKTVAEQFWDRPQAWPGLLQQAYNLMAQQKAAPPAAPSYQPLRPSGAIGGPKQPKDMAEAMMLSLSGGLQN